MKIQGKDHMHDTYTIRHLLGLSVEGPPKNLCEARRFMGVSAMHFGDFIEIYPGIHPRCPKIAAPTIIEAFNIF